MIITKDMAPINKPILNAVVGTAHTLIAGTTGSGKSVLLNDIIYYLLKFHPAPQDHIELALFDTKRIELKQYAKYHNTTRITEPEDAPELFRKIIKTMDERYEAMEGKKSSDPPIYVIVDELADLVSYGPYAGECLDSIIKIGRLGRAANIHLICCTQDPSRHTLTAQLMQNFTTCIALRCKTQIESRQIIGVEGAEKLPKYGKAIVCNTDGTKTISIPVVSDDDAVHLVKVFNEYRAWWEQACIDCGKGKSLDLIKAEEPEWIDPELKSLILADKWEGAY